MHIVEEQYEHIADVVSALAWTSHWCNSGLVYLPQQKNDTESNVWSLEWYLHLFLGFRTWKWKNRTLIELFCCPAVRPSLLFKAFLLVTRKGIKMIFISNAYGLFQLWKNQACKSTRSKVMKNIIVMVHYWEFHRRIKTYKYNFYTHSLRIMKFSKRQCLTAHDQYLIFKQCLQFHNIKYWSYLYWNIVCLVERTELRTYLLELFWVGPVHLSRKAIQWTVLEKAV